MVKRNKKLFLIIGVSLIVLIILSPFIYGVVIEILSMPHRLSWRDRTSPLNVEVIQDLCQKFNLSDQDPRCKPGAVVYAPEFFQMIRKDFIHSNGETVNYDYVQEKIGRYKYECSQMIKERTGAEYFSCRYDLQGDHVYPIGIFFTQMESYGDILQILLIDPLSLSLFVHCRAETQRAESVETHLCPATELAGAQVALQRSLILLTSTFIVL